MSEEKGLYLWEFSRNLLVPPHCVRVAKECPKTFWLDLYVGGKVNKVQNPKSGEYVGYTNFCFYYLTQEDAESAYKKMKKQQEERIFHSSQKYIEKQAVKRFVDKELVFISHIKKENAVLAKEPELKKLIDSILCQIQNDIIVNYKELYGEENEAN